jgi:hypothetical protein
MNVHALPRMFMQGMRCMWFRERGHRLGKSDLPGNTASGALPTGFVVHIVTGPCTAPVHTLSRAFPRWGVATGMGMRS